MKHDIVGQIYSTSDYSIFKRLEGNRQVLDYRKNTIIQSIKDRGWIRNPIVVNEKYQIIDGQGREEALEELKMPVEFVIAEGANINDCIALNIRQSNWKLIDYIKCYADIGNKTYQLLYSIINKYKDKLNVETILNVSSKYTGSDNKNSGKRVHHGTFVFITDDRERLTELLDYTAEVSKIIGIGRGRIRTWSSAIKFAFLSDSINHMLLLEKLQKYSAQIVASTTVPQALTCFEKIYNYQMLRKNKVFFLPEYEKYLIANKNKEAT